MGLYYLMISIFRVINITHKNDMSRFFVRLVWIASIAWMIERAISRTDSYNLLIGSL